MGIVLSYGASGTQGGPVARQLIDSGEQVRLLVRDPEKVRNLEARGAELAVGDLIDLPSLQEAHQGVDRVFLHLPLQYDFELHRAYATNAITAAREAEVELLVINTTAHVFGDTDVEVYNVRQEVLEELDASGVPNVVLRPSFYMDNFLGPWVLPAMQESGVIAFALPNDHPMQWVSSTETGRYCAAALDRPDLAGTTFDIGGPDALTGDEIAANLSALLGRELSWMALTPQQYQEALVPLFGPAVAAAVADQVRYMIDNGLGAVDMESTRTELGVEPLSLESWAKQQDWGM